MKKEISEMLKELGVTANYAGYYQTLYAVLLAAEDYLAKI